MPDNRQPRSPRAIMGEIERLLRRSGHDRGYRNPVELTDSGRDHYLRLKDELREAEKAD